MKLNYEIEWQNERYAHLNVIQIIKKENIIIIAFHFIESW